MIKTVPFYTGGIAYCLCKRKKIHAQSCAQGNVTQTGDRIMVNFCMLDIFTLATITEFSSALLGILGNPPISKIRILYWDGEIVHLPKDEPMFVHASNHIQCSRAELAWACAQLGHVPFYDDALIDIDGTLYPEGLHAAASPFFKDYTTQEEKKGGKK